MYGVEGIGEKAIKKQLKELIVILKGFVGYTPFESETDDVEGGTELVVGLENLLQIVSGWENEKYVTFSTTFARKNEDWARV